MFRAKVSRHALAKTYLNQPVRIEERSCDLPVSHKQHDKPAAQEKPPFDARPFALCIRIFAIVILSTVGTRVPQPLASHVTRWTRDGPNATASVSCVQIGGFSPVVITCAILVLGVLDDACAFVWKGSGAAPGLRHAAVMYASCALAGVTEPTTLILASFAVACWPSLEYDAPAAVILWVVAWAIPIAALIGGSRDEPVAMCFILVEWVLLMFDAASARDTRVRPVRAVFIEVILVAWFLGPGKLYRAVPISC